MVTGPPTQGVGPRNPQAPCDNASGRRGQSGVQLSATDRGFAAALDWARSLGAERVWALEDCRHVSGAFERFLLVNGERVVRVATHLMAGERRGGRERGKSDLIDAIAVARPRCEKALTG